MMKISKKIPPIFREKDDFINLKHIKGIKEKILLEEIETQEWYIHLIEQCQAIITEAGFHSRWMLIEGYHQLGKRILQDYDNFDRVKIYGQEIVQCIAISLEKSPRTIYQAIQFAKQYPDLSLLPEGKNISWYKIVNKYLPKSKNEKEMKEVLEGGEEGEQRGRENNFIEVFCPRCKYKFQVKCTNDEQIYKQ